MFPELNLPMRGLQLQQQDGKCMVRCLIRKKQIVCTPEEWVRQHMIAHLHYELGYPLSLMKIERLVKGSIRQQRADLLLCDRQGNPRILVECKAPEENLSEETVFQLGRYNRYINAPLLLMTNGLTHYCLQSDTNGQLQFLDEIPKFGNT